MIENLDDWLDPHVRRGYAPSALFRQFLAELDRASAVAMFAKNVIPGLAQTLHYTQWLMREFNGIDTEFVNTTAVVRAELQVRLRERGVTPYLVTTEAALRRQVGPRATWREQLLALDSHATLYVLTGDAADRAIQRHESFTLLNRENDEPKLTCWTEVSGGGDMTRLTDQRACEDYSDTFDEFMAEALRPVESTELVLRILEETA